jgi:hypothetical protein
MHKIDRGDWVVCIKYNTHLLHSVGVKFYICNIVAWKMYNIKFKGMDVVVYFGLVPPLTHFSNCFW